MAIYIGVNGQVKEVVSGYIGNAKGEPIPIYTSDKLPDGYYPVRYVYSDSSSSGAPLELCPYTRNTRIICMCSTALEAYSIDRKNGILSGTSSSSFSFNFFSNTSSGNFITAQYGSTLVSSPTYISDGEVSNGDVPISKRYVIDINRDTSYGIYLKYGTGSYNLLFNNTIASAPSGPNIILNYTNSSSNGMGTKYYYLEIYENIWTSTKPTMQLYPCIWNNNGTMVAGLYDVVGKQFYGNNYWENGPSVSSYDISL